MGMNPKVVDQLLTRNAGAAVNGPGLYVGGQLVSVHAQGPVAGVMSVEMSYDGNNWIAARDNANVTAAITTIAAAGWIRTLLDQPLYVRGTLTAGAAADYAFRWVIHKLDG